MIRLERTRDPGVREGRGLQGEHRGRRLSILVGGISLTRRDSPLFPVLLAGLLALTACGGEDPSARAEPVPSPADPSLPDTLAAATFAGGCFWCVEEAFDAVEGVVSTTSGYTGGRVEDPTYEQVSAGGTGHAETVRIVYDPDLVTYERLLEVFWRNVDPTDPGGQFCDRGDSYRSAIFVHDAGQRRLAEASKRRLEQTRPFDEPIVTPIVDAGPFWPAEEYHQDYHRRNPIRYKLYKWNCGRERRLDEVWGEET
ncbi:MAG: peptide-methionine (S)-S-oxide reductase MsrA [Gemmatimonadetes bacterium]|nr:peptide-methionine (S)-S-oxide reductase MsrA [Gemmatimonadota bacterium]